MKITNKFNLPDSFVEYAQNDKYTKGDADISVTSLIDSPRVRLMKSKYWTQMESDVSEMVWPLFGTAVHHVLESSDDKNGVVKEQRMYADVAGWVLSGAVDHMKFTSDGTVEVTDYKVTSAWSVIFGKEDWHKQLNCYAWLIEKNHDVDVKKLTICAILRDWQRKKAEFDSEYPQAPIVLVDVPLWSKKKREEYIYERIDIHQKAQILFDFEDEVVPCNDEDRWAKPDTFAVMKKGQKKAVRVLETQKDAEEYVKKMSGGTYFVEKRKGEYSRCAGNYCSVSEFCEQWKGWK